MRLLKHLFFLFYITGPLYRVVAYDAVCFNGTQGLYFVAITQFCIVAFAMIMVTLRFAFKPGVNDDPTANEQAALTGDGGNGSSNDAVVRDSEEVAPQLSDVPEKLDA
jgi:hypothetical protein